MTALTAHRADTTSFERTLLLTASAIDHFVALRLERRATARPTGGAAADHDAERATAQALGGIGMLPR